MICFRRSVGSWAKTCAASPRFQVPPIALSTRSVRPYSLRSSCPLSRTALPCTVAPLSTARTAVSTVVAFIPVPFVMRFTSCFHGFGRLHLATGRARHVGWHHPTSLGEVECRLHRKAVQLRHQAGVGSNLGRVSSPLGFHVAVQIVTCEPLATAFVVDDPKPVRFDEEPVDDASDPLSVQISRDGCLVAAHCPPSGQPSAVPAGEGPVDQVENACCRG